VIEHNVLFDYRWIGINMPKQTRTLYQSHRSSLLDIHYFVDSGWWGMCSAPIFQGVDQSCRYWAKRIKLIRLFDLSASIETFFMFWNMPSNVGEGITT